METGFCPDVTAKSSQPRAHCPDRSDVLSRVGCFRDPYASIREVDLKVGGNAKV
jgi:hypothetical protein